MEARLKALLTGAYGCLERLRSPVANSDTMEMREEASWRVIAVIFPRPAQGWPESASSRARSSSSPTSRAALQRRRYTYSR